MKNRVPTKPGRVKLTFDDGTVKYAKLERADEPTEAGTPLDKGTFLPDSLALEYGLSAAATPAEVFAKLKWCGKRGALSKSNIATGSGTGGTPTGSIYFTFATKKQDDFGNLEASNNTKLIAPIGATRVRITVSGEKRTGNYGGGTLEIHKNGVKLWGILDDDWVYLSIDGGIEKKRLLYDGDFSATGGDYFQIFANVGSNCSLSAQQFMMEVLI